MKEGSSGPGEGSVVWQTQRRGSQPDLGVIGELGGGVHPVADPAPTRAHQLTRGQALAARLVQIERITGQVHGHPSSLRATCRVINPAC